MVRKGRRQSKVGERGVVSAFLRVCVCRKSRVVVGGYHGRKRTMYREKSLTLV